MKSKVRLGPLGHIENDFSRAIPEFRYQHRSAKSERIEYGRKLVGHQNLTSIKGIGDKSAAVLLSVIGDCLGLCG